MLRQRLSLVEISSDEGFLNLFHVEHDSRHTELEWHFLMRRRYQQHRGQYFFSSTCPALRALIVSGLEGCFMSLSWENDVLQGSAPSRKLRDLTVGFGVDVSNAQ